MLSGRAARDPVDVAERLLAIQAQDLRGGQLAVRARTKGVTVGDIDRALTADRSLLITWVNRGTLHLIR
ncbi:MAG: winged helix DNA-binding domain-containing protein, partial [Actinobacteria bacterium]